MITIKTIDANGLLTAITTEIKEGKIETWTYEVHNSHYYFTHTPSQWVRRAWLKASVKPNELNFTIDNSRVIPSSNDITGVYYGRFIEMLRNHFPSKFFSIVDSPDATRTIEKISALFKRKV